jgi:hypothetical protein
MIHQCCAPAVDGFAFNVKPVLSLYSTSLTTTVNTLYSYANNISHGANSKNKHIYSMSNFGFVHLFTRTTFSFAAGQSGLRNISVV